MRFLKQSFKHIEGMQHARKQGRGLSELERYDTREVELLIERKLLRPSNNVLECAVGIKDVQALNQQLWQDLKEIRHPVKKTKEVVVVTRKKEEKPVPVRFDPRLDMGNLYWYGQSTSVRDPVLQGGQRKITQNTWGPVKTFFTSNGREGPVPDEVAEQQREATVESSHKSKRRSSSFMNAGKVTFTGVNDSLARTSSIKKNESDSAEPGSRHASIKSSSESRKKEELQRIEELSNRSAKIESRDSMRLQQTVAIDANPSPQKPVE